MRAVCLIPARSGSKGLKNKNMLFFDGKPLIFHTIDAAIESGCFAKEDIYVSSDSQLYLDICKTRGISTILRDPELSKDTTPTNSVGLDFLRCSVRITTINITIKKCKTNSRSDEVI